MTKLANASLRVRVLVPLTLLLVAMTAALVLGYQAEEEEHTAEDARRAFLAAQRCYDTILATETRKLFASLAFLTNDPAIGRALERRDQNALLELAAPVFQRLRAEQQVTHFYFLAPDRSTLLRVHQPGKRGDVIRRHSVLEAESTRQSAAGVELGSLGTFTLRVVAPRFVKGRLAGYVELGQEVEPIMRQIKEIARVDLAIAIDKQFLHQDRWAAGMRMMGRGADAWERLPGAAITFSTLPANASLLSKAVFAPLPALGQSRPFTNGRQNLRIAALPLREAGGRAVGNLFLLRDVTERFESNDRHVALMGLSVLTLGGGIVLFFYFLLGRVERSLADSRLALVGAGQQREAAQARHIEELEHEHAALRQAQDKLRLSEARLEEAQHLAHLGNWEWNIPQGTLFWSDEIYRIFGLAAEAFQPSYDAFLGAVHPDDRDKVKQAVERALHEKSPYDIDHRIVLPDGTVRTVHERAEAGFGADGEPVRMVGTVQDITDRRKTEEQLNHLAYYAEKEINYLAYYDSLTGLPNRALFGDRLLHSTREASCPGRRLAVMLLDVDRFKDINDTLGHEAGDRLLKIIAERLQQCVRGGDTLARLSGDEFALVLTNMARAEDAALVAQKIMLCFEQPFAVAGTEVFVTASVGITIFPTDGRDLDVLLKNADSAMFHAKGQGRNNYQFYAPEMTARTQERFHLEAGLRHAVAKGELLLHYQPQVTRDGRIAGVEALVRWQHPELGMVPPAKFIPLAEESNLIVAIGEWVLKTACTQAKAWQDSGLGELKVAVNLSTRQFRQNHISHTVAQVLQETGLDGRQLELEITESLLVEDGSAVFDELFALKTLGATIAIDDFGTGYSSLSYLKRFPIDILKIDQAFVRDATKGDADAALVRAIISLARSLNLSVIAEGVETPEQAEFLRSEGCEEMQGYYFARPMPAEALAEFVRGKSASHG